MKGDKQVARRNRPQVIIMAVAFPVLLIFGIYSLVWLAQQDTLLETTNRGEFVDPPLLARELGLADGSGMPVDGSGSWWVWLVTADCMSACEGALQEMRILQERMYDHADAVRQALVTPPDTGSLPSPDRYPRVLRFTSDGDKALDEGVYLVDPAGNVVLRYPADTRSQPIFEDLGRLLEVDEDA